MPVYYIILDDYNYITEQDDYYDRDPCPISLGLTEAANCLEAVCNKWKPFSDIDERDDFQARIENFYSIVKETRLVLRQHEGAPDIEELISVVWNVNEGLRQWEEEYVQVARQPTPSHSDMSGSDNTG